MKNGTMMRYFALAVCLIALQSSCVLASSSVAVPSTVYVGNSEEDQHREYILDTVVQKKASQPIIRQWRPSRRSIWHRYKGTVLQTALVPSLTSAAVSLVICIIFKETKVLPGMGSPFAPRVLISLERLVRLWKMHLTTVSFFLAFFLNTAKGMYSNVLSASRSIQGRLADMNLICAENACRDADGKIAPEALEICETISRYTSVISILFYAGVCRRYKCLLDDKGLQGLVKRGLLTEEEGMLLHELAPTTRHHAVMTWIMSTFTRGCEGKNPCFRLASSCHKVFLSKVSDLRGSLGTISDLLDARCQLSYVHFIQFLVDTFLVMTPFAAVADMGWYSIYASFLLSMFFSGLLDLSKMLFDPLDNDEFGAESDNIQTDVLLQETNGGSQRYMTAARQLPYGARPAASATALSSTSSI